MKAVNKLEEWFPGKKGTREMMEAQIRDGEKLMKMANKKLPRWKGILPVLAEWTDEEIRRLAKKINHCQYVVLGRMANTMDEVRNFLEQIVKEGQIRHWATPGAAYVFTVYLLIREDYEITVKDLEHRMGKTFRQHLRETKEDEEERDRYVLRIMKEYMDSIGEEGGVTRDQTPYALFQRTLGPVSLMASIAGDHHLRQAYWEPESKWNIRAQVALVPELPRTGRPVARLPIYPSFVETWGKKKKKTLDQVQIIREMTERYQSPAENLVEFYTLPEEPERTAIQTVELKKPTEKKTVLAPGKAVKGEYTKAQKTRFRKERAKMASLGLKGSPARPVIWEGSRRRTPPREFKREIRRGRVEKHSKDLRQRLEHRRKLPGVFQRLTLRDHWQ